MWRLSLRPEPGLLRPTAGCAPGQRVLGTVKEQRVEGGEGEGGGSHVRGQRDLAGAAGH